MPRGGKGGGKHWCRWLGGHLSELQPDPWDFRLCCARLAQVPLPDDAEYEIEHHVGQDKDMAVSSSSSSSSSDSDGSSSSEEVARGGRNTEGAADKVRCAGLDGNESGRGQGLGHAATRVGWRVEPAPTPLPTLLTPTPLPILCLRDASDSSFRAPLSRR